MNLEVPPSWVTTNLAAVADIIMGQSPPSTTYNRVGNGLPFFQGKAEFVDLYPTPEKYCSAPQKVAEPGDILISVRAPVGPTNLCQELSCIGRGLAAIRASGEISSRFLFYYLRSIEEVVSLQGTGSTFTAINRSFLSDLQFYLPPFNEQRRIIAKLETLLDKVDSCQRRLSKIPILLKRFRQAVLEAACSGRLTADWREKNSKTRALDLPVDAMRYQLVEPESDLPELPETWRWVALGNYGRCMRGRFSIRPRNDPSCFGGEHPFIQIGDLPPEGGWVCSHTQTLNNKGLAVSKKFPKGTALVAIVGATIGNTGLLAYDMCFTDSIVGIETGTHGGNRYVELFLRNQKYKIRQASYSSGGQPNIKLEFLNPYPLALPPLAEQREIVRRVDELFALADQVETRYAKAKQYVVNLKQSILAKAFCGELVRQDPGDEPATALLERIREARGTEPMKGLPAKMRT
jgi:type I restriction enzyme S subunit